MWLKHKKTGNTWYVTDEEHIKRLIKSGDFEQVEVEEKKSSKRAPTKRDDA
ncbi:hypothetical protein HNR63_001098 [Anoxybacillus kamchatkensis]|uniref:hypothetical protein n=1 Tax=Anoxybacillus ayderensis TaxID=265546 RepID=UPI0015ECB187|nr:hypothetical protein [Anoxybacillus ayderensis]MBA2878044.1 hypothetical protein [Anoxybacillus ayderensis]